MKSTISLLDMLRLVSEATRVQAVQAGPANAMFIAAHLADGRVLSIQGRGGAAMYFGEGLALVDGFLVHIYDDERQYNKGRFSMTAQAGPGLEDLEVALRRVTGPEAGRHAGYLPLTHAELDYLRLLVDCDEGDNARGVDTDRLVANFAALLRGEQAPKAVQVSR